MNAVCGYDFTIGTNGIEKDVLKAWLEEVCKKWTFQEELGGSGYEHFQGRFSTKVKVRQQTLIGKLPSASMHISITSNANKGNMFYVTKEDTRTGGPWADTDENMYVPRQVREVMAQGWRPWQQQVIDTIQVWDTRTIHMIYDTTGNIGKSIVAQYIDCTGLGIMIPYVKEYKDVMRMVMDQRKKGCYILDLPRAIKKDKMREMYAAIETIKSGYAYDDRYAFKKAHFDCPQIFVFTNTLPDIGYMSLDRWSFLRVDPGTMHLVNLTQEEMRLIRDGGKEEEKVEPTTIETEFN